MSAHGSVPGARSFRTSRTLPPHSPGQRGGTTSRSSPPLCGGYEAVFRPELDRKHVCPVCLGAMREAVQTPCGHRFCRLCIQGVANSYEDDQIKCPVDNHWFSYSEELFADNAVRREILSLTVICNNNNHGCSWTGELRDLEGHLGSCDCVTVQCENGCTDLIFRRDLADHLDNCPQRPITCGHCGESVLYVDLTRHEVLECAMFPVRCTLCGTWGIKRHDIQRHLDKDAGDCPQGFVACPYHKYGCQHQEMRQKMSGHMKEATHLHLSYVEAKVTSMATRITDLNKKLLDLNGRFEERISQYETILREVVSAQATNYTGALLWKVNLASGMDKFTSSSFYTGSPGYKLHASLELGYADQGTTYASLFVTLEKGQFDEDLLFPFNAVCDVSLMSQTEPGSRQYSQTVECRNVPRCRLEGETMNCQRGRLRFIPVEEISSPRFCRDGSVYLELNVRSYPRREGALWQQGQTEECN